ncbi:MAG: hypothetical protein HYR74_04890 [Candidatus Eisenbacteria bacterium]|nr:hypothetical protein [Candidatus Eisenbacteria bacterium]
MVRVAAGALVAFIVVGILVIGDAALTRAATVWYTGQRAFGNVTVEPAVDDATGEEIFLLTPNGAPFPSKAPERAQAPLYLVAYPTNSTITDAFNCTPTTCDHAQRVPFPWYPSGGLLKGHDHLVGVSRTGGDFNVAWDVELDYFTQQGFADGAINHRILTLDELNAAKTRGDVQPADIGVVFNCSSTNVATYLRGRPLTFTP